MKTTEITELLQRVAVVDDGFLFKPFGKVGEWYVGNYVANEYCLAELAFFAICERCEERGWIWSAFAEDDDTYLYSIRTHETVDPDISPIYIIIKRVSLDSIAHAALLAYLAACESVIVECSWCNGYGKRIPGTPGPLTCTKCKGTGKVMPEYELHEVTTTLEERLWKPDPPGGMDKEPADHKTLNKLRGYQQSRTESDGTTK